MASDIEDEGEMVEADFGVTWDRVVGLDRDDLAVVDDRYGEKSKAGAR